MTEKKTNIFQTTVKKSKITNKLVITGYKKIILFRLMTKISYHNFYILK